MKRRLNPLEIGATFGLRWPKKSFKSRQLQRAIPKPGGFTEAGYQT